MERNAPWWMGTRGEWYVVVQGILFLIVAFGPPNVLGLPAWTQPWGAIASVAGGVLMLAGALLALGGLLGLGANNLTALPYPRDGSTLVVTGAYRIVRNPIYGGLILGALGWALWVHGSLTLLYALALFAFFDVKSRREERWLAERYSDYASYQKRVRKLIPWVY